MLSNGMEAGGGEGNAGSGRPPSLLSQYDAKLEKLKEIEKTLRKKEKEPGQELRCLEKERKVHFLRNTILAKREQERRRNSAPDFEPIVKLDKGKGPGKGKGKTSSPLATPPMDTDKTPIGDKRTREESEDDEEGGFWETAISNAQKKKAKRVAKEQSHTPGNFVRQEAASPAVGILKKSKIPKYRMSKDMEYEGMYQAIRELEKKYPQAKFTIKPNLKEKFVLHPENAKSSRLLEQEVCHSQFNLVKLDPAMRENKSIVLRYPKEFPLELLEDLPNVLKAERCVPKKEKTQVTKQVLLKHIGPLPSELDLGHWGSYKVRPYVPEPLRCFRCQKFGHHQAQCTYKEICAICSKNHATSQCMEKLKQKAPVQARCANCKGGHHAWYAECPARKQRVRAPERTQKPVEHPV